MNSIVVDAGGSDCSVRIQKWKSLLSKYWPFALILVLALVLRSPAYGDPDVSLDEQFYLVVADRMLQGALPYVDIWDRKPIGLFLIYAAARLLGGEGFIQYQIVAAIFAGLTAGFIWLIARRASNNIGAILAALAYLFWLNIFSGNAGQSPVFYNLFMSMAAYLAFLANDSDDDRHIMRLGIYAMLLCGLALQVKYTAVAEGAFLGCWFMWRILRTSGQISSLVKAAVIFALLGLAPTILVSVYYLAVGHFPEFAYANFFSVFDRARLSAHFLERARTFFLISLAPLAVCLPFAMVRRWQQGLEGQSQRLDFFLLIGWLTAAACGFAMIGNFYDHYILPMLVPLFTAIAPLLIRAIIGVPVAAILIGWSILITHYPDFSYNREKREKILELADATRPYIDDHCLFIYDGPAVVYMLTQACAPTRFVYPDHLSNDVEKGSIGADTVSEMRKVLASRPGAIITASAPVIPKMNAATLSIIRHALINDYKLVAAIDHPDRTFYVYALRSLEKRPEKTSPIPYEGF